MGNCLRYLGKKNIPRFSNADTSSFLPKAGVPVLGAVFVNRNGDATAGVTKAKFAGVVFGHGR